MIVDTLYIGKGRMADSLNWKTESIHSNILAEFPTETITVELLHLMKLATNTTLILSVTIASVFVYVLLAMQIISTVSRSWAILF